MATQVTDERVVNPTATPPERKEEVPIVDRPQTAEVSPVAEGEAGHPPACRCATCAAHRIGVVVGKVLREAGLPLAETIYVTD